MTKTALLRGCGTLHNGGVIRMEHRGSEEQIGRGDWTQKPLVGPRSGADRSVKVASHGSTTERGVAKWVTWQSVLYAFVLGWFCVLLVPLTSLWWLLPLYGAAVPIALAVFDGPGFNRGKDKERELLGTLAERDEITPTTAAMRTSLTVDEASKMLDDLAGKGHLKPSLADGIMVYALRERDRQGRVGEVFAPLKEEVDGARLRRGVSNGLEDPLSGRELEVLALLASGRTNSEVARDLFVSVGTVKSHTNNIYRKLGARNRAGALARARGLDLL